MTTNLELREITLPHLKKIESKDDVFLLALLSAYNTKLTTGRLNTLLFYLSDAQRTRIVKRYIELKPSKVKEISKNLKSIYPDVNELKHALASLLDSSEEKKKNGVVFTPTWLADYITKSAIKSWRQLNRGKGNPKTALDSSCGPGVFLNSLDQFGGEDLKITGIDINEDYLALADIFGFENHEDVNLENCDYLLTRAKSQMDLFSKSEKCEKYDIIVGNPPYIRSQTLNRQYADNLMHAYPEVLAGNFDMIVPYLYATISNLSDGGVASLIVSNKFLKSKYGDLICKEIFKETRLLQILDFGDGQLFKGSTTYTSIISFSKSAKAKTFSFKRFDSGIDWSKREKNITDKKEVRIPTERLENFPWQLSSNEEERVIDKINSATSNSWSEVFESTIQGVRTGANDIFLVDNNLGLEANATKPFVSGEHIRAGHLKNSTKRLIWPYVKVAPKKRSELMTSRQMEQNYPKTYEWLTNHHEKLASRKTDSPGNWFSFIRNQNLDSIHRPKIIGRELMPKSEFAPDSSGEVTICSGYALLPFEKYVKDIETWSCILSTEVVELQLRRHCTQLRNGWFRILKHSLAKVRLPELSRAQLSNARKISKKIASGDESLLSDLNAIVGEAFGLSKDDLSVIKNILAISHEMSISKDQKQKKSSVQYKGSRPYYLSDLSEGDIQKYMPVEMPEYYPKHIENFDIGKKVTFSECKSLPVHRWYKYTQGYSPNLVGYLLKEFGAAKGEKLIDPFLGSGTTIVEGLKNGLRSVGCEISPLMCWIAENKTRDWDAKKLNKFFKGFDKIRIKPSIPSNFAFKKYFTNAYSEHVLSQIFGYKKWIEKNNLSEDERRFLQLGLISILEDISLIRKHGSHYRYLNKSTSVGLSKLNIETIDNNADIKPILKVRLAEILSDIEIMPKHKRKGSRVVLGDFRNFNSNEKFDYLITSPPYLNRNNYMVQQKGELVVLGMLEEEVELKRIIKETFRSHVEAKLDKTAVSKLSYVNEIVKKVELSDNNNPKIPHMIAGYFDDLLQTFIQIEKLMKSGGKVAFVVGCSRWGGIVVPVDHILCKIAESQGFGVDSIIVTRLKGNSPQQMQKYGKISIRESIVLLTKK